MAGTSAWHKRFQTIIGCEDVSVDAGSFEFVAAAVPEVKDLDLFLAGTGPVNDAVHMGLVAVEEVPEIPVLRSCRTSVRVSPHSANGFFQTSIPREYGDGRASGIS